MTRLRGLRSGLKRLPAKLRNAQARLAGLEAALGGLETRLRAIPIELRRYLNRLRTPESRLRGFGTNLGRPAPIPPLREGESMSTCDAKPATDRYFGVPWNEVHEPGAYVSTESGRLFRISKSIPREVHSPAIDVVAPRGEEMVRCISTNPYTPIEKVRQLALEANIQPKF